ncbi:SatD family protein [Nesterenkonia sp.]|uniref:SatD family protein n=1 Tax=Nesterenkonia sp. TaxID=704201 RepID=UPI00261FFA19|nr:SatD family protein [Nesterenkonia sp.]
MSSEHVAVIADVIDSRSYPDRSAVQQQVEQLLQRISDAYPPLRAFTPTVGDELQAVYSSRAEALAATLYAGLLHESGPQLRFGLGQGEVFAVTSSGSESIEDGPGWWRAREAVESAHRLQRRHRYLRSRFVGPEPELQRLTNAYLLLRDQTVEAMSLSARRYARGMAEGRSQESVAEQLGVSQPAVSKSLRSSGAAAVLQGLRELTDAADAPTQEAQ